MSSQKNQVTFRFKHDGPTFFDTGIPWPFESGFKPELVNYREVAWGCAIALDEAAQEYGLTPKELCANPLAIQILLKERVEAVRPSGARKVWHFVRRLCLYWDVWTYINCERTGETVSVRHACKEIRRRPEWKRLVKGQAKEFTIHSLENEYSKAAKDQQILGVMAHLARYFTSGVADDEKAKADLGFFLTFLADKPSRMVTLAVIDDWIALGHQTGP